MPITIDGTNGITLPTGNLGVGTSSPSYSLQVVKNQSATTRVGVYNSNAVWNAAFTAENGTNIMEIGVANPSYGGYQGITANGGYIFSTGSAGMQIATSSGPIQFFNTAGTERMRIDASGRVTKPSQPYAQGSGGNGYTLSSAGFVNGFNIIYNNVDNNIGGYYNNTNGRFTAPVAGVYLVCYTALISTSSSSTVDYRLSISINGNQSQTFSSVKATGWPTLGGSQMVYMNANDYVVARFWNDSGVGTMHSDANYNRFSIMLLG